MENRVHVRDVGFTTLYESSHPTVDIVFVHGFTGHPEDTWTLKRTKAQRTNRGKKRGRDEEQPTNLTLRLKFTKLVSGGRARTPSNDAQADGEDGTEADGNLSSDVYWPADLARKTAPDSRVLTYGYDTRVRHRVVGQISQNTVSDHARDLLSTLEIHRRNLSEKRRPVLFVVHSLGGIVVKEALRMSRDCVSTRPHLHNIFKSTVGIIFFGTPHHGSDPRSEEYGVGMLNGNKVVEDTSSCLGDPTLETKQHISSNHMDMCRFSGLEDAQYKKVAAAITDILGNLEVGTNPTQSVADGGSFAVDRSITVDNSNTPDHSSIVDSSSIVEHLKRSLREQLYFDKIDERLTTLTAAQGSTCRWFLAKPEYAEWKEAEKQPEHGGFLWIKGNPGTGKSTLMKFLFEGAKVGAKGDPSQIMLSFFFHARGTTEEKSTAGLYRSLLHQLFEVAPDLIVAGLEWMTAAGARVIERDGWHEESLKQTLTYAVRELGRRSLTIFVDALDECMDQTAAMVCFFEDLCESAIEAQVRLQICFSSRHYPTVVIQKGIEVVLEHELGHRDDIETYIKSRLRMGRSKRAETLRSEILEKSSGIFLWVVLVVDILNSEFPNNSSIANIRKRLDDIPPKLHDLFEMILARDGQNLEQMRLCLVSILFATRPLQPQELYFAVQLGLDRNCSTAWDQEDVGLDEMKTFVRSSSKGLAEVTRKSSSVQFIHESVRDFLLDRGHEGQLSGDSSNFIGRGHKILRDCCAAQIDAPISLHLGLPDYPETSTSTVRREALRLKFPFLEYAVLGVLRHADGAQRNGIEQGDFLVSFQIEPWRLLSNALERHAVRRYKESVDLLYILAENNLTNLIRICPERLSGLKARGERYGPPIFAALATGSYEAAETLLVAQAEAQSDTSPLFDLCTHYAEKRKRHTNLGRNFAFSRHKGVLTHAVEFGDEVIVAFLIDCGQASPDLVDRHGRPLLYWATQNGHVATARILLERGADIEVEDNSGRAALSWAAERGDMAMASLLVEKGAAIEGRGSIGMTPLCWAAENGKVGIARFLLDKGAGIEGKDSVDSTPLSLAAENGHVATTRLLLEKGACIEGNYSIDGPPLGRAAENGHEVTCTLLLEEGADIEGKDNFGETPLYKAVKRGHTHTVMLLIQRGANIEAKTANGMTPLMRAAADGKDAIAGILLEKGSSVDARNGDGSTPLHCAARNGRSDIVRLLLDKGAKVEVNDDRGLTPLSLAVHHGNEFIIRLLRKKAQVYTIE
ncbi:uncharacterized protein DNG_00144 [Cephalotrichum gorgonifer]|uniref:Nephrocystin 3-like N-terminal domain-containing protein n=1 Tax=Cephalotrichum gorgonifer TaxID=2041049 RepID=A0AAE8MN92_9PEZI|nr:uncharacterized protein DNG_00144 [Cephalotrichum gorgonifer]